MLHQLQNQNIYVDYPFIVPNPKRAAVSDPVRVCGSNALCLINRHTNIIQSVGYFIINRRIKMVSLLSSYLCDDNRLCGF